MTMMIVVMSRATKEYQKEEGMHKEGGREEGGEEGGRRETERETRKGGRKEGITRSAPGVHMQCHGVHMQCTWSAQSSLKIFLKDFP